VPLDTVEEVLCPNCQNSLEDSQLFSARLSQHGTKHHTSSVDSTTEHLVREMSERLSDLERQVLTYRERVSYHESMEDELKRNLESQVDVVLKMEEERLLLLRDSKELRDKNRALTFENEEFRGKISMFETELEEL
jgi:hypothetical protein